MARNKIFQPPVYRDSEPAEEPILSESLELDDILHDFAPAPEAGDTIRLDREEIREKMQAGDTMQFHFPKEEELPKEEPKPESPKKPLKRRGRGVKGRKKARAEAKQQEEEEKTQQEWAGSDTVRLDRTLIAAKAAEAEGQTVRFSIPASQEAAFRAEEKPAVRVYTPKSKGPKPILYDEDVLTPEDMEEIARAAAALEAEQAEEANRAAQAEESLPGENQVPLEVLSKTDKKTGKAAAQPPKSLEKQYEEAAMGLGGAQVRLFLAAVLTGVSLILTALDAFDVLDFLGGVSFLPFLQVVLLLLCALMTYDMVVEGLLRLFRLRPDVHTVLFVLVVFSAIDGVQCILTGRTSFSALTCLCLTTALWADCEDRSRILNTVEVVRRGGPMDAALREPSLWEGKDGILRGSGDMEQFLRDQERIPGAVHVLNIYSLLAMTAAAVVSGLTCGGDFYAFTRTFTGMLLAALPALSLVAVSRPRALAAHRLKFHGAALSGWEGARNARGSLAVPLADSDLFPADKLRMNGMKLYPEVEPDKTIAYGTAAICASGSGLAEIFTELLEKRNLRKCRVENLKRYDNGGISADIGQDSVLAGSLTFMQAMGVEMPQGTRVNQAVYVAVNGFLGGVFAVNYAVTRASIGGLGTLVRSAGITPVLTAQDFVITPQFLHSRFKVNTNRIVFPTPKERAALSARQPSEQAKQCALLTRPEFSSMAKAVSCGRAVYASAMWSTVVSLLSGIIGLAITGVLAWIGALDTLAAGNLLLYTLVWSIPLWILGGWVRSA